MKGRTEVSGDWERVSHKAEEVLDGLDRDEDAFEEWRPSEDGSLNETRQVTVEQASGSGIHGKVEKIIYQATVKVNPCYFAGDEINATLERTHLGKDDYRLTIDPAA